MSQQPEPTVGALIFNPEGKLLLIKSSKWNNYYTMPGGHVEFGETLENAVKREVKEETGMDIHDIELLTARNAVKPQNYHRKAHFVFLDFVCKTNDKNVKLNEEGKEFVWIDLDELDKVNIEDHTKAAIERYKEGNSGE